MFWFFKKKDKKRNKRSEEKSVYEFTEDLSASSLANKAFDHIEKLANFGPRQAGSDKSRMAANNILSELEKHTDTSEFLPFTVDKNRYVLWTKAVSILIPISSVFIFFGLPYISIIFSLLVFAIIYFEGMKAKGIFSHFSEKGEGRNVRGEIKSEEEEERIVILSCHHDSANLYKNKDHLKDIYIPIATVIYNAVLSLFLILHEGLSGILIRPNLLSLIPIIFSIVSLVLSALSIRIKDVFSSEFSPGVGDNLTGIGIVLALSEYFSKKRLKHTKIEILSFDAEEQGLQGSRDYYGKYSYPLGTININIDGIYSSDSIAVLLSDANGLKLLDRSVSMDIVKTASSMGYKIKSGKMGFFAGQSDAVSAKEHNIRATTITSMASGSATPAHTEEDGVESVDMKSLEEVIAVVIKYIEGLDKKEKEGEKRESLLGKKHYKLSMSDD